LLPQSPSLPPLPSPPLSDNSLLLNPLPPTHWPLLPLLPPPPPPRPFLFLRTSLEVRFNSAAPVNPTPAYVTLLAAAITEACLSVQAASQVAVQVVPDSRRRKTSSDRYISDQRVGFRLASHRRLTQGTEHLIRIAATDADHALTIQPN
jgi:hypothetical protein